MPEARPIEIDGSLVGVLARDVADCSFHFYSSVAPYELLDGSRFARASEACAAIHRMSRAARRPRSHTTPSTGVAR